MSKLIGAIQSAGFSLQPLTESDLESTLDWRNRAENRVWFKNSELLQYGQHAHWFHGYLGRDNDIVWVVWENGCRVGQVAAYDINTKEQKAEVGRFLAAPEFSGRGKMFNACRALIEDCHARLGLKYFYLEVFSDNARALKMYHSLGFEAEEVNEGLLRMGLKL